MRACPHAVYWYSALTQKATIVCDGVEVGAHYNVSRGIRIEQNEARNEVRIRSNYLTTVLSDPGGNVLQSLSTSSGL